MTSRFKDSAVDFAYDAIKRHEGYRSEKYTDPEGFATIGFGHKIKPGENIPDKIDLAKALEIFSNDFIAACEGALKNPVFSVDLAAARQAAFIDLAFNMGDYWWEKFPKTIAHMKEGNWILAGDELLNSKYASQVGYRARENSELIKTGEFPEDWKAHRGVVGPVGPTGPSGP